MNKFNSKYMVLAFINTLFGYFSSILFFFILYEYIAILLVGLISHIINVTFSFILYKLFLFKTSKSWWLSEYIKTHITYGLAGINGIVFLWIFFELFNFNIFLSQFVSIITSFGISYYCNKYFIFRK